MKQPYLVQTSPFLGQVHHPNGEVEVVDYLIGHFELFDSEKTSLGHVTVDMPEPFTKKFTFSNDTQLTITELQSNKGKIGSQCWLSSIAFAIWCQQQQSKYFVPTKKTILELGSGVGLGGISLASWSVAKDYDIVMTEYIQPLIETIRNNITTNNQSLSCIPKVKMLDWDNSQSSETGHAYDCIIACDCVYKEDSSALIQTIVQSLDNNPTAKAIVFNTSPKHRLWVNEFKADLQLEGQVTEDVYTLRHNHMYDAEFILLEFQK